MQYVNILENFQDTFIYNCFYHTIHPHQKSNCAHKTDICAWVTILV